MSGMAEHDGNAAVRFIAQVVITLVIWFATLAYASAQLTGHQHGAAARGLLAVIGILGFVPWLYVAARSILAQDEFTQRIHLVAIAFAFAATALTSLSADFLHKAGFIPELPFGAAWMVMGVIWWLSLMCTSRYYR
jgi:hypothetical protein